MRYTHFEIEGEEAILFLNNKEVDRIDLISLVQQFLDENKEMYENEDSISNKDYQPEHPDNI